MKVGWWNEGGMVEARNRHSETRKAEIKFVIMR